VSRIRGKAFVKRDGGFVDTELTLCEDPRSLNWNSALFKVPVPSVCVTLDCVE
jgi:hypothetical protein